MTRPPEYPTPVRVTEANPPLVIVGCGGTGAFLVKAVCRQLYGIKHQATLVDTEPGTDILKVSDLTLVDGDVIEARNALRQDFMPTDAGRPKSLALAERYSAAYGLQVRAHTRYLTLDTSFRGLIPEGAVVVGCVDNAPTRRILHEALHEYENVVYLDAGNGALSPEVDPTDHAGSLRRARSGWSGQVVCGVNRRGRRVLPFPADLMPDLIEEDPSDPHPADVACGQATVSEPQRQMTNLLAATTLMQYLTTLVSSGTVIHSHSFFDAFQGYVRSSPATHEITELSA